LGHLGKLYPEVLLELASGKKYLKFGTIYALKLTGEERLKTIAKEALKVLGDDCGPNYPTPT
jgi:RNase P/RNase MRP subunit POP5